MTSNGFWQIFVFVSILMLREYAKNGRRSYLTNYKITFLITKVVIMANSLLDP